ncbi:FKBP-type peptidyl-prolyl cis-trans isomerase N-terminal domain-containing protein [Citrobacter amalonaticus]|uniref:FKBP-type peptidyl-prolyl cis-trans isomerase N-terminal domain-containing protein n=1 Tax=Citrobacter amalonaticus TaxID=35703 RepID=UPI002879FE4B|nr:FKBP-type peptidyl-prolyl cis-trans isomerase N-terminal domain-containing protein [Citrobacter amalonaticus]MDS4039446.1 FKBP-type peptidyl-prolyl cis-trans isomerase N-terminal domain-containing protein [Citrobacter amalonaticus]
MIPEIKRSVLALFIGSCFGVFLVPDCHATRIDELLRFAETTQGLKAPRKNTEQSTEKPQDEAVPEIETPVSLSGKETVNTFHQLWPWLEETKKTVFFPSLPGKPECIPNTLDARHSVSDTVIGKQSWASGYMTGQELKSLVNERRGWKVQVDTQQFLAGILDAFSDSKRMTNEELSAALDELDVLVTTARSEVNNEQKKKGDIFRAAFKKKKDVNESPSGFLYRIDNPGDDIVKDDTELEITIRESLIDGTVVSDMERDGVRLEKPRSQLPPLIKEATGYIRNHGALTMVVPPELAYGDEGFSPTIPPGATMVYFIRMREKIDKTEQNRKSRP